MNYNLQRLFALAALVMLSPLITLTAILVRVADGRPVLFRQTRVGRHRDHFTILKFRTMHADADQLLSSETKGSRVTPVGRWLRRTSLDELPQLLNVVMGQMAIIGPRALLPEVAANVPEQFARRFDVLPGLTGLAQISGRNELLWSRRLSLDAKYAETRSTAADLRILFRTAAVIIRGTGFSMDRTTAATDDLGLLKPTSDDSETAS